jgi:choline dehydrogenase
MVEAGVQAGYPRTDDLNGYQQEGFGPMDRTVTPKGRRSSTARGYLDMAKGRPNLTIITHAMTNKILFNQNKRLVLNILLVQSKQLETGMPNVKSYSVQVQLHHRKFCNVQVWVKAPS